MKLFCFQNDYGVPDKNTGRYLQMKQPVPEHEYHGCYVVRVKTTQYNLENFVEFIRNNMVVL
jgi:hypothetical protein